MNNSARVRRLAGPLVLFLYGCFIIGAGSCARGRSPVSSGGPRVAPLIVGTTGDYRPFSYMDARGDLVGFDLEIAERLARRLRRDLIVKRTSWPTLMDDLRDGVFQIAMSGITRTAERESVAAFSQNYWKIGKCPLVRRADAERWLSLDSLNDPSVRVGVNPGGTNEAFVRKHLPAAKMIVIDSNMAIPDAVASGEVDVMITDNVEAIRVAAEIDTLAAVRPERPFTEEYLAYLAPETEQHVLAELNNLLEELERSGELSQLKSQWLSGDRDSTRLETPSGLVHALAAPPIWDFSTCGFTTHP